MRRAATRSEVRGYRLRANRLDRRGPLAGALPAGLQDSAPRAAQLALHARVDDLPPDAWADPSLVQVWGPRGAVYVIGRADLAVFTLGRLPRAREADIRTRADRAAALIGDREVEPGAIRDALNLRELSWRELSRAGRLLVRWDARTVTVRAVPAPHAHVERARHELARRYLRVFGPSDAPGFAAWARVPMTDALRTFAALADEIVHVDGSQVLLADLPDLAPLEVTGVRLLPPGDPYLRDVETPAPQPQVHGTVLVDGDVRGWWERQGRHVTLHPDEDGADWLPAAEAEAAALPL